jgi:hypothetical protein
MSCTNDRQPPAPMGRATADDFREWWAGRRILTEHCVCARYPRSCHFHVRGTITDGPHNLPMVEVRLA